MMKDIKGYSTIRADHSSDTKTGRNIYTPRDWKSSLELELELEILHLLYIAPRATELGTIVPKGEGTHPSRCVKSLQVSPGHVTSEKSYTCSSKTAMTIKRGRAVTYGPETQPPSHVTFSNVVM